jgi:hypothetical protein
MVIAAEMALSGIDPMAFLAETDRQKRAIMIGIARASREIREKDANNLAVRIVNGVGELLGGR